MLKNKKTIDGITEVDFNLIKNLQAFKLDRSMVKKAVMTYSYNTSYPRMVKYIKDCLYEHKILIDECVNTLPPNKPIKDKDKKNSTKSLNKTAESEIKYISVFSLNENSLERYITSADIQIFIKLFKIVISREFPKYGELKNYIKGIVRICCKLNIPIP